MSKVGKKHANSKEKLSSASIAGLKDALQFVLDSAHVKFDESVDVDIVLGSTLGPRLSSLLRPLLFSCFLLKEGYFDRTHISEGDRRCKVC